ncbi:transcription antitermination factor NusB [Gardnerella sp. 2492-Sm]|uniref:transcription antitermination factor NusB n=1 Tax=unclassified Gardnerella TaxID=2628112 RepID=UPI003CFF7DBB
MARSTARKRALNTLYEADEKNQNILSLLEERLKEPGAQTPLPDYAVEIVRGVGERRNRIDKTLNRYSTGWKVGRMAVIDRNILRMAVWEILLNDEIPDKVAIDEAIALAKMYSEDDAISFVHGLLSAIVSDKDACLAKFNGEAAAEESAEESTEEEAAEEAASDTAESSEATE